MIISAVLLMLQATDAQVKYRVSGVVSDVETGEKLMGVAVFEKKLQVGAVTDEKGFYELDLPAGSHTLQFSFLGYVSDEKMIDVKGKAMTVNIRLKEDLYSLFTVLHIH